MSEQPRLGVDIGGVIIGAADKTSDTSFFSDNFLATPPVPGSFDALAALNDSDRFRDGIWLVSKAGPTTEDRTRKWLAHYAFSDQTGIHPERFHFTTTREGKLPIATELGLTDFVDDKMEVLGHVAPQVDRLYWYNPNAPAANPDTAHGRRLTVARDWQILRNHLLEG